MYCRIRRLCAVWGMTVAAISAAVAQSSFGGTVTDEQDRPLEGAAVTLLRGSGEQIVAYTLTDANGAFSLTAKQSADSMQISVSMLGYRADRRPARTGVSHRIRLQQQAFQLKEVEIRPGRVWGRQDTVNYNVARFLSPGDESIKDVIRKLPGVDVDENGKISYNGKDISRFYVEGMDLVGGQYNRITDNLQAKSVETVQILENHQPVRALQKKVHTENIALNLKLKPEFRDRWMVTVQGGLGAAPPLWEGVANALQLSRKSQSAYTYRGNNTGHDVSSEQMTFFVNRLGQMEETNVNPFLKQPSLMAPLKKERLLFNNVNTLSANRLYKFSETAQVRLNAAYTHDVRQQERGSETSYYRLDDTVRVAEQSHTRIRSDEAELSVNLENNAAEKYLTNRFKVSGGRTHGIARYTGSQPLVQRLGTTDANIRNDFKTIWNRGSYTLQIHSLMKYDHLPSQLEFESTREKLNLNLFYSDNSISCIRKRGSITHQYTAGVNGQIGNIRNGMSACAIPAWQWNTPQWNASLSVPLVYTGFRPGGWNRFAANPSLSLRYKLNYAWQFSVSGRFREMYGDVTGFYAKPYHIDYRTVMYGNEILPVNHQQAYSAYAEYKRTVQEFFATLTLSHVRTRSNRIIEQRFDGTQMALVAHALPNDATGWNMHGTVSKGFYDWGMKLSLDCLFGRNRGEQLSSGERMSFESAFMQYEPKISWTPTRRLEISCVSTLRYGGSAVGNATRLASLWHIVQKLQFTYDLSDVSLLCRIDHYHNDVGKNQAVNALFGDLSARWKTGSWQFDASVSNLFDRRQYGYTEYSSVQSYTSWIHIRGREFMASARYRF
ncbi:MAG: TonB-dependent receptor [Tannerella sp.]|jgi:hypothetical protein|nr:TonB-dependent receptor [Tannerella sp.]